MKNPNSDKQEIVIPTRDSLAEHRGSDVCLPLSGCTSFFKNRVSQIVIATPTGDCYAAKAPGDPKIVFPRMVEPGAPTLIGNTREYKDTHEDQFPQLSEVNLFSVRFDAIVREIVDTFNNMIVAEPDKIKEQLQSQAGFRIFLDSLEHSFGAASAPVDENISLPPQQQFLVDKRATYLELLETHIKKALQKKLVESHFLETNESLDVFLGDDYPDGGKFADFKIVKKPQSPPTNQDLADALEKGGLLD